MQLLCHVRMASPKSREGRRERGYHNEEVERHPPNYIFHRKNARVRGELRSKHIVLLLHVRAVPKINIHILGLGYITHSHIHTQELFMSRVIENARFTTP